MRTHILTRMSIAIPLSSSPADLFDKATDMLDAALNDLRQQLLHLTLLEYFFIFSFLIYMALLEKIFRNIPPGSLCARIYCVIMPS